MKLTPFHIEYEEERIYAMLICSFARNVGREQFAHYRSEASRVFFDGLLTFELDREIRLRSAEVLPYLIVSEQSTVVINALVEVRVKLLSRNLTSLADAFRERKRQLNFKFN